MQTAWPVDAAGLRTTTRARPETARVRAVVARSPRTTALRRTRFASTRLPAAPTGPATGKSFFGGVPEMGRKRRTCHLHRRLEISGVLGLPFCSDPGPKNLGGSRACGGCGQPRTGGAGPLMRGCPTAEGNHRPDVRGLLQRARGCPRPGSLHKASTRGGTRARSCAMEDAASPSTSRPCPGDARRRRGTAVEMRPSRTSAPYQ